MKTRRPISAERVWGLMLHLKGCAGTLMSIDAGRGVSTPSFCARARVRRPQTPDPSLMGGKARTGEPNQAYDCTDSKALSQAGKALREFVVNMLASCCCWVAEKGTRAPELLSHLTLTKHAPLSLLLSSALRTNFLFPTKYQLWIHSTSLVYAKSPAELNAVQLYTLRQFLS
jgi:hypothetical protein